MTSTFKHELKHWSIHAFFCTSPSFILACFFGGYGRLPAVLGILFAIATTILIFAFISSSSTFQSRNKDGLLRRSISLGAKIRSGISAVGLVGVVIPPAAFFLAFPDMLAGLAAIHCTHFIFQCIGMPLSGELFERNSSGVNQLGDGFWLRDYNSLIPTYITTLIEGLIITVSLMIIASLVAFALTLKREYKSSHGNIES